MNDISLNEVYATLLTLVEKFPDSTADVEDIREECHGADAELAQDIELFKRAFKEVQELAKTSDMEQVALKLTLVCAYLMNIETVFSNLVDTIQDVAFSSGNNQK